MDEKYLKNLVLCIINGWATTTKWRLDSTCKNEKVYLHRFQTESTSKKILFKCVDCSECIKTINKVQINFVIKDREKSKIASYWPIMVWEDGSADSKRP